MTKLIRVPLCALGLTTFLFACLPAPSRAQSQAASPLFLALPDDFPDVDARAVLMLEPGRDIVLLKESDAEPETLHVALAVLERMRSDHPRPSDRGQLVPITGFAYRANLASERQAELTAVLQELEARPNANVGNLGTGRWMPYVLR